MDRTTKRPRSPGAGRRWKAPKTDDEYVLLEDNEGMFRVEQGASAHPTLPRGRIILSATTHRLFAQREDNSVTEITTNDGTQFFAFARPSDPDQAPMPPLDIPYFIERCNCSDSTKRTMANHYHQSSEKERVGMEMFLENLGWPSDEQLSKITPPVLLKFYLGIDHSTLVTPQTLNTAAKVEEVLIDVESATDPLGIVVEKCAELFYDRAYTPGLTLTSGSRIKRPIVAPYLAVVQGSGVGKTTALYELASHFQHSSFLLLSEDPIKLLPAGAPKDEIRRNSQTFREMVEPICEITYPGDALKSMEEVVAFTITLCNSSSGITKRETGMTGNKSTTLLVIDEASWLVGKICAFNKSQKYNAFRLFQKALRVHCLKNPADRLVVVVADTISGVGNFVPTEYKLPNHLREDFHEQVALNLFPVVHFPLYFDVHAKQAKDLKFRSLESFQSYGRPLWKNNSSYNLIIQKVSGKLNPEQKDMALLGTRLPMRILQSQLASDLIGHSTALCTFVSANREIIRCKYPSEPIVAEAVASEKDLAEMVIPLRNALLCRHIESGRVGELVAQFLLLQAFDLCARGKCRRGIREQFLKTHNNHVTLNSLLAHFAQPKTVEVMGLSEEYCVFFNHFQEIETDVTPQILSQALHRGCALMLKEGARGADLAVPLYLNTDESGDEPVGTLWIQVKNVENLAAGDVVPIMEANRGSNVMCGSQEQYIASIDHRDQVSVGLLLSLHPDSNVRESCCPLAHQPVRDSTFSKKDFEAAWPSERKFPTGWNLLGDALELEPLLQTELKENLLSRTSSKANKWNALLSRRKGEEEVDLCSLVTLKELVEGAEWREHTAGLCVGFKSISTDSALSLTLEQLERVLKAIRLKKARPFDRSEQIAQSSGYVESLISDLENLSVRLPQDLDEEDQ